MPRKKKKPSTDKPSKPVFHEGLEGFDIKVNSFGQMESTFHIDQLNAFLNKEVKDRKLDHPDDPEEHISSDEEE